jgi:Response regulator containing a CheY-like receiver domain and a GGDEF domain
MVDKDEEYTNNVRNSLASKSFKNVVSFIDETECLKNMSKGPKIVITDSHLKCLSGLQLIKKARLIYPDFFSILLSKDFQEGSFKIYDERFLQYVDKYIIKGMDDMEEIIETVTYNIA